MGVLHQVVAVLVAVSSVTLAFPSKKHTTACTIHQIARPRPADYSPSAEYAKALSKFSGLELEQPDFGGDLSTLSDGSVPAVPEPFDLEYLTPVKVGDQTLNLNFDTGSADL